jgi:hypothetical protein
MLTVAGGPTTTEAVLQRQVQSIQRNLTDKAGPSCYRGVDANSRDKSLALERSYTQYLSIIAPIQNLVCAVLLYTGNPLASAHLDLDFWSVDPLRSNVDNWAFHHLRSERLH